MGAAREVKGACGQAPANSAIRLKQDVSTDLRPASDGDRKANRDACDCDKEYGAGDPSIVI